MIVTEMIDSTLPKPRQRGPYKKAGSVMLRVIIVAVLAIACRL